MLVRVISNNINFTIQSFIVDFLVIRYLRQTLIQHPPRDFSILGGALLLVSKFAGSIRRLAALFCISFQQSLNYTSHLIFFRVSTVFFELFCASAAHKSLACNDVLKLSLCLDRRIASLNPK